MEKMHEISLLLSNSLFPQDSEFSEMGFIFPLFLSYFFLSSHFQRKVIKHEEMVYRNKCGCNTLSKTSLTPGWCCPPRFAVGLRSLSEGNFIFLKENVKKGVLVCIYMNKNTFLRHKTWRNPLL